MRKEGTPQGETMMSLQVAFPDHRYTFTTKGDTTAASGPEREAVNAIQAALGHLEALRRQGEGGEGDGR